MVQGGKYHDRGCERVHVVCKTSNWCNGIAPPPDGVGGERSCKAHNFPSRNTTLVNSSANGKALTSLGAPRIAMSAFHSARRYGVSRLL